MKTFTRRPDRNESVNNGRYARTTNAPGGTVVDNSSRSQHLAELRSMMDRGPAQLRRANVVQRKLSPEDKAALIEWAKKLKGTDRLGRFLMAQIDQEAERCDTLEQAQKRLQSTFEPPKTTKTFSELMQVAYEDAARFQKEQATAKHRQVAPGYTDSISGEPERVLYTGAASSCIAVAAFGGGTAFLAHWTNSDLSQPEALILKIQTTVGDAAPVWLAGELVNSAYGKKFQEQLTQAAFKIQSVFDGRTLAIRGDGNVSPESKALM
jgi:hypothetical protein